jgi:hypothetical protein
MRESKTLSVSSVDGWSERVKLRISGSTGRAATSVPPLSGFGVGDKDGALGVALLGIELALGVDVVVVEETTHPGSSRHRLNIHAAALRERLEGSTNAPCARHDDAVVCQPTYH